MLPALLPWRVAVVLMGGGGMIAQAILLRELIARLAGSELYIGLIIGNWVAAGAAGAFAAGRFFRDESRSFARFTVLITLFSLLFPLLIFLARGWRAALLLPLHEALPIWQTLPASIVVISPLAFIQGGLFVLAASIHGEIAGKSCEAPGRVYALETIGTILGGALATFLLIPSLSPFHGAALVSLANGAISVLLIGYAPPCKGALKAVAGLLLFLSVLLAGSGSYLDTLSQKLNWQGDDLVESFNTPYQNIAVIRNGEQHTLYGDGAPLLSLPYADIARVEENTHIPLLAHPEPRRVLLLGGGSAGYLQEILKHPSIERIDYVERDGAIIETVRRYAPEGLLASLQSQKLKIHNSDGRLFLKAEGGGYDLILIDYPLPLTLQGNRFFTEEFFMLAKKRLKPGGIVSFSATGSMSYYGADLKAIAGSLGATLGSVFPHLLVVPGEINLYMASDRLAVDRLDWRLLAARVEERGVKTALVSAPHLEWLLGEIPRKWFAENAGVGGVINRDFSPWLLVRNLSYMTNQFSPETKQLLGLFSRVKTYHLLLLLLGSTMAVAVLSGGRGALPVIWTVASTGFTAMLLELSFFFIFQLYQGVMVKTIGLLIALFMTGLWLGSRLTSPAPTSVDRDLKALYGSDALLVTLSAALWLLASGFAGMAGSPALHCFILFPLIFLSGSAAGAQFPPAVRLTGSTSTIYGFDLLGGWLGGLLGGALLLPLLGFGAVAVVLILLKTGSTLCLYLRHKEVRI